MVDPRKRVFISYARKDAARLATMLQQGLQQDHDVSLDNNRITGGATWSVKVEKAIDNCDVFLAPLSPGSYVSDICRAEQLRALRSGHSRARCARHGPPPVPRNSQLPRLHRIPACASATLAAG